MRDSDRVNYVNFNQLRSFFAVAKMGSFTRAAELLSISQPTVTTQVKNLEESYNVQLFKRSSQGLELTDTGTTIFEIVRQIFSLEERAFSILSAKGEKYAGKIHIGSVGPFYVMELISSFREKYPLIQVSVESANSDAVYNKLVNFDIDVGILGKDYRNPKIEQIELGRHEIGLMVSERHVWSNRDAIQMAEMDGQFVIFREKGSMTRQVVEEALTNREITPNVVMELGRDSMVEAVASNLGAGIISVEEMTEDPRLRFVRFRDDSLYTISYAACLKERKTITPIKAFMSMTGDFLEQRSSSHL